MKKLFINPDKIRRLFLLTIILLFIFGISYTEEVKSLNGKELLDKINSNEKYDRDYALGYITGVYCAYMEISVPAVELLKEAFDRSLSPKK